MVDTLVLETSPRKRVEVRVLSGGPIIKSNMEKITTKELREITLTLILIHSFFGSAPEILEDAESREEVAEMLASINHMLIEKTGITMDEINMHFDKIFSKDKS